MENNIYDELLKLQTKAIDGDPDAQFKFGQVFYKNNINLNKAVYWISKAAENGNVEAQAQMGLFYNSGECGLGVDYEKATKYYLDAVKNGYSSVRPLIDNLIYMKKIKGEPYKDLFEYYDSIAAQGEDSEAIFTLGLCYENGVGTPVDIMKAIETLKKSFELKNENATLHLAELCDELNYEKLTFNFYKIGDELFNNPAAQKELGNAYFFGYGAQQIDRNKAVEYYSKSERAFKELAQCYYTGRGVEKNIPKAIELLEKDIERGFVSSAKYPLDILKKLNGREIVTIENISDLKSEDIDESKIGAIHIIPSCNEDFSSNTLYSIEDYKECQRIMNEIILKDVPENDGTNELEIFLRIANNITRYAEYDVDAYNAENVELLIDENSYKNRNMINGLINRMTVCAGYSEIFRNALASKKIDCINVSGYKHAFNQVKIDGKWYYTDITSDRENLKSGLPLKYTLLSEEEFKEYGSSMTPSYKTPTNSAHESYDQEKLREMQIRVNSQLGQPDSRTKLEENSNDKRKKEGDGPSL